MTRRRRVGVAAAIVMGAFALYEVTTTFLAYTADAYVQSDLVALAPQITGRVVAVHVADNQNVVQGDLLASIDPVPFQLNVDQRRAEVDETRAQAEADQHVIASAEDALAAASSTASYAHETQARMASLTDAQDVARADLDQANNAMRRADAERDAARQTIDAARSTAAMHRAAQMRAAAALATAEWQLARTRLISPTSGTVTGLTVRVGDTAQADIPLIGIIDAHAWRIVANYKESDIRGLQPGDTAWVWLDSDSWHLHRGKVAGIARGVSRDPAPNQLLNYVAPTTDWIRLQRRFPVTLTLVDPPANLPLYMGADARVLVLP
jgi:membrane fusion protein, multidrug efflux system